MQITKLSGKEMKIEDECSMELYTSNLPLASELVKMQSGKIFLLSSIDINYYVSALKDYLIEYIKPDSTVGLFLDMGTMEFLPMLIYRTCIEIGATVLRFGSTNLERQIWLLKKMNVEVICSSPSLWNIISKSIESNKKVSWINCMKFISKKIVKELSNINESVCTLIELHDIPAVLIEDKFKMFHCPGYIWNVNMDNIEYGSGELSVSTHFTQSLSLKNHYTGIPICSYNINEKDKGFKLYFDISLETSSIDFVVQRVRNILKKYQSDVFDLENIKKPLVLGSLTKVELLVTLEEEFLFRVEVEQVSLEDFKTQESIINFVRKQIVV